MLRGLVRPVRRAGEGQARAEAAWLVPEDLRPAVLAVYESDGFLAARVEIPKLTFAGDVAQLKVKIDEGPVVPIREVSVTGAERLGVDAVRAAAGSSRGPALQAGGDPGRQGPGREPPTGVWATTKRPCAVKARSTRPRAP